ncbi:MAG: SusC/RagA family TonB-linked outer membrane protein [Bacteroidales bacterium]|nr:SusC/RagA family TonB-linked outer membrane protein [Bacteroidales bacterium]
METYNIAVVTDNNGKYSVAVSGSDAVLVFSFVGYATQEVIVGDRTDISVTMAETATQIEEVVVVGYGVQKKESIVGSIVQTTNEELMKSGNVADLRQALTGRLPGVTITTSTGEPGGYTDGSSATQIFIRGRNSWNNSQPLILVDGVERAMENVDVAEVESISVLKDASATAVFGVKGANGVILITTKRGKKSRPELTFSYDATALMVSKLPDILDSYDALRLRNESIERNVVFNEAIWSDYTNTEILRRYRERDYPEYEMVYPNVDWEKAVFKSVGWSHKAALNVTGGTAVVKYFGALSYLYEGDMYKEYETDKTYDPDYSFRRFNFRSNFDFNLTKTTILKINLAGYFGQKGANYGYLNSATIWRSVYGLAPDLFLPQYADGTWGATLGQTGLENPVASIYNLGKRTIKTTELDVNMAIEQKLDFITKGLSLSGLFFYDNNIRTDGGLYDVSTGVFPLKTNNVAGKWVYPERYTGPGQDVSEYTEPAPIAAASEFEWVVQPWTLRRDEVVASAISRRTVYQLQLNYTRRFGTHNVGGMGVFKRDEYAIGNMFPSYREDWAFRATYDYDSRYFIETNGAYNGSEKFSSDYRFDFFPSFAAGWYVSNEKFFQIDWWNRLKFRYSLGLVGDDAGGARWAYMTQYAYGSSGRLSTDIWNLSPYTTYREVVVSNPDLHWEKAKKSNYGIESGFWNDLLSVNFDFYTEDRKDIIVAGSERAVSPLLGTNPPAANLGKVRSRGFELELSVNKRTSHGLDWWASLAVTHTRNKILFRDDPQLLPDYLKSEGYAVGQQRSQLSGDIYQTWDDVYASTPQDVNDQYKIPGFYHIMDYNADGVISATGDVVPYAYPDVPENTYSLTLGAAWKNFSLMVQFYGVNNVTRTVGLSNFRGDTDLLFGHTLDYWSKDNPDASSFLPRWKTVGGVTGNYFCYDASYIRLKTAEIAYDIPPSLLDKWYVSSIKLFVNGNNLWWWSKLPDDRETNGGLLGDAGAYPTLRRINFGIKVIF